MSRYIDAEWLLNFFEPYPNDYQTPLGSLRACVDDAPSIDLVRCKECMYWHKNRKWGDNMSVFDVCYDFQANDFCRYGEREGE